MTRAHPHSGTERELVEVIFFTFHVHNRARAHVPTHTRWWRGVVHCQRKCMSFPDMFPEASRVRRLRRVLFPAFVLFEQMDGISQAWSTLSAVIPNTSCCRSVSLLDILPFCSPALFLPLATYFPSVPSSTQPRGLFPVKWLGYLGEGGGGC